MGRSLFRRSRGLEPSLENGVGLGGVAGCLLGKCDPTVVARIVGGDKGARKGRPKGLHFSHCLSDITRFCSQSAVNEVRNRGDTRIVGISLRLHGQLGCFRIMQASLDIGDCRPHGRRAGSYAGVALGVGQETIQPGLQVPGEKVPILVVILRCPARTTAGDPQ